jgi:DNA-directed RNA polymerase subunit RPC12/RpoP
MTQTLACPGCGRSLNVPEDLAGRLVKCPACHKNFTAPEVAVAAPPPPRQATPAAPPPPAPPGEDRPFHLNLSLDDDPTAAPPRPNPIPAPPQPEPAPARRPRLNDNHDDLRDCPRCGKHLHRDYVRCPYCGHRPGRPRDRQQPYFNHQDTQPHRGGLILALGIIGLAGIFCAPVGLVFGICAWVMGRTDLAKMRRGDMDREGEGLTYAGRVCGIIATSVCLLLSLCFGLSLISTIIEENQHRHHWSRGGVRYADVVLVCASDPDSPERGIEG